jgi:acyl-CoA synthetase (NDP forming)
MPNSSLKAVLDPKSIAIIGASDNPNKIGGRPLIYLSRFGYRGTVYPINPKRTETLGYKTYPALKDLPETPEVAIVAVPGDAALAAVDECADRGVKAVVLMSSGFGESDPVGGKEKERRMVERARARGTRIIGPNSQGLANFGTGAILSFSTMYLEAEPADGPVAVLSQSGAMAVVPYSLLRQRGIGVRHSHATGNDCDVTVSELAAAVVEDPEVKLLLLYLESIPDPEHLAEVARIARERDLPVIALKSGRTAAGQAAASSHTGALANEDRVVDAFLEHHGIWRVRDTAGLVDAAELYLKGWRPKGRRLVAISNSGAVCVMSADAASMAGMPMAKLAGETRAELGRILPSFATTTNPIDITAALLTNSRLFGDILPVIAKDPAADAFVIGVPVAGVGYDVDAFARDTATFAALTGKPLVVAAPQPNVMARFKAEGLPVFTTETQAVDALNQYISHLELMERAKTHRANVPFVAKPRDRASATSSPVMLNEADSLALAQSHGLPVVAHRLCQSAEECVEALQAIGGPVAVKGCSADIAHKSELGLVRLSLDTPEEVTDAWHGMERIIRDSGNRFDGVIVAAMRKGRREMIIGAHRDPVFGPVVMVGDGGKYVEALPDLRLLLPPFSADEVAEALARLRIAPVLGGVRGEPPMDLAALSEAVAAVGRLMVDPAASIVSLDLNPVLVGSAGEGCAIVDAVIFRESTNDAKGDK